MKIMGTPAVSAVSQASLASKPAVSKEKAAVSAVSNNSVSKNKLNVKG
jgi:hypothetical protein